MNETLPRSQVPRSVWVVPYLLLLAAPASAKEPTKAQLEFFEKKVRPVLADNCFSCHSAAKGKKKGGLLVDSREALLKGGDSGPAIVPGDPEKSLLVHAIWNAEIMRGKPVREIGPLPRMPPKKSLSATEITDITEWIRQGAVWAGPKSTGTARIPGVITEEDRKWWAFQPIARPAVPDAGRGTWAQNEIDRFILAKLQAEKLQPSPPAARAALARRVYFDLVGVPPTPAEIDAFVADAAPDAYERLIDRLLASPRYGERWARHWLDVARYSESDGYRIDDYRPDAWRYRDYVIRSFNEDKPYDRFVSEQLAGDELWPDDPEALTATGFLRLWIYEYNQRDARAQWNTILDDLTDVAGDAFLGLSFACARCHDHKFDPILQKDYYRLRAFFAGMLPRDDVPLATPAERADFAARQEKWEKLTADVRKEMDAVYAAARTKAEADAIFKFPEEFQAMIRKPMAERTPLEHQLAELAYRQVLFEFGRIETKLKDDDKKKLIELKKKLSAFDADRPAALPVGLTVADVGPNAAPTFIPKKAGGTPIEPGFLTILNEKPAAITPLAKSSGRRTALARWLTQRDNPLTARVMVNRIWQSHFGRGLVATSSDFGRLGEKPSHPELLDWLATRFMDDGWSIKKMHRLILLSSTYRQSATSAERGARRAEQLVDPENRLLWKMPTRRLDAEQIRDAILSVTGEFEQASGGPAVRADQPRRTIYTRTKRNSRDALLDVFDAPEGFTSVAERNVTTTPTQALLMMNSPYTLDRARVLAARAAKEAASGEAERVDHVFRLLYGRTPTKAERSTALTFLREQANRGKSGVVATEFKTGKIPYREGRAAVLQPGTPQARFELPDSDALPTDEFTIEAFVQLRSTYETAAVRPIAAHWAGDRKRPGWSFGVTGKQSVFKVQNLVLQLFGDAKTNGTDYEAIFSGLQLTLEKPYYVAVSVKLSDPEKKGITFYAKDLSNDEEPVQIVRSGHKMTSLGRAQTDFIIGGHGIKTHTWDGLIDDVRLSSKALRPEQLLLSAEGVKERTVGYWQFEAKPGPYRDSSSHALHLRTPGPAAAADVQAAAFIDLCHVLLNSNEFLYVD
jgi:hypothetical protein